MTTPVPPSLERFGDELNRAAHRELSTPSKPVRARVRRPRLLAGSTLGLAGVGAALVLALSAGGAAAPPAFAVTRSGDGSLLVNLSYVGGQTISQVNQKLASMGANERFSIQMAAGPAAVSGPVTCTRAPGVSGPTVKALVGQDGTDVISSGQSAGNTAEGTFHMVACYLSSDSASGNSGAAGSS